MKVTQAQLVEMIRAEKSCRFFAARCMTEAQASKAKAAQVVLKESVIGGLINFSYERSVNRQARREGTPVEIQAQPRKWGKHETLCLIEHKGAHYVQVKVERTLRKPRFWLNGKPVSKAEVAHLLPTDKPAPATQDHLEKKVIVRDYAVSSIREFRLNGKRFQVVE